jgi:predicted glycogen debranching enzyme
VIGDPAIRPNQVIAVGLPFNVFSREQTRAVIDLAEKKLVTPLGLRTLTPDHPAYCGTYIGTSKRLAAARHNGSVYPWLVTCFTRAHKRLYDNPRAVYDMFEPLFGETERSLSRPPR